MRQLTTRLIIPITFISFFLFTKWWYTIPVDAPHTMLAGFPLPYVGPGWHTSLSLQIFVGELIIDLFVYFLFWYVIIFCINRFLFAIKVHRVVSPLLWFIALSGIAMWSVIASQSENLFYFRRDFDMKVVGSEYKFIWQRLERPDAEIYNK